MSTKPAWPVFGPNNLVLSRDNDLVQAHPCGDCSSYSIYGVCFRNDGCYDVHCKKSFKPDSPLRNYCPPLPYVIFSETVLDRIEWGPHHPEQTGTLTVSFFVDHEKVKETADKPVVAGFGYYDFYEWPANTTFSVGWHTLLVVAIWKDADGAEVSRIELVACVYVVENSGVGLHDLLVLPTAKDDVICIDSVFYALLVLGPYVHFEEAKFVKNEFKDILTEYVALCTCPDRCRGYGDGGNSAGGDVFPDEINDITPSVQWYGDQHWIGCLPSSEPFYVTLGYSATFDPIDDVTLYLKFYDSEDEEIGEIELGYEYYGTFLIPRCTTVKFVWVNSSGAPIEVGTTGYGVNWIGWWANTSPPEDAIECPYEDGELLTLVPGTSDDLNEWVFEGET